MVAMKMVAERPEGPRTTEVNNKEQGYNDFYTFNTWPGEDHMVTINFNHAMGRRNSSCITMINNYFDH